MAPAIRFATMPGSLHSALAYRRCPGEQLTIQVFEDFLRKVCRDKIAFRKLNLANPGLVPIGPNALIEDDIGFARSAYHGAADPRRSIWHCRTAARSSI